MSDVAAIVQAAVLHDGGAAESVAAAHYAPRWEDGTPVRRATVPAKPTVAQLVAALEEAGIVEVDRGDSD